MDGELSNLNREEQLKAENEFLKMKLMLEHGGQFGVNEHNDTPLPPEIENQFLNNILAFEKQFQERKTIKVFDKLGRPDHFKPEKEISDDDISNAWQDLSSYMKERNIHL